MLLLVWLAEQGVWVAPLLAIGLYLGTPKADSTWWSKPAVWTLAALFVVNATGTYPGPARVSCTGLPPTCTENVAGAAYAGDESRARLAMPERPGFGGRTAQQDGSARGRAAAITPPVAGGGSLTRVGADTTVGRRTAPTRPNGGLW